MEIRMRRIRGEKTPQLVGGIWTYNSTMRFYHLGVWEKHLITYDLKTQNFTIKMKAMIWRP